MIVIQHLIEPNDAGEEITMPVHNTAKFLSVKNVAETDARVAIFLLMDDQQAGRAENYYNCRIVCVRNYVPMSEPVADYLGTVWWRNSPLHLFTLDGKRST